MLQYPEIPGPAKVPLGRSCIAFSKYDGSNLRFEWTPKRGWYKFGTRTQLVNASHPVFGPAVPMFVDLFGAEVVRRVRDEYRGMEPRHCLRRILWREKLRGRAHPR